MPLAKAVAGLRLEIETPPPSRPGSARGSAPTESVGAPTLSKQNSFDIVGTSTFSADQLQIHGAEGMRPGGEGVRLEELTRESMLGRGASGKVVLMRNARTNERYALKELEAIADESARHQVRVSRLRIACNPSFHCDLSGLITTTLSQASTELRIAHSHASTNEHLVGLIDAYFVEGKIGILMEYCDAGSLADAYGDARAGVKGLPIGQIVLQICQGLRYMHREMKQVHRDLKPANCLLTSAGLLKLSDFGISKQLDSSQALAMTQVGSTAYMSPERLKGDEYSFVSDVWSVGIIAHEGLTGEHPFPTTKYKNFLSLYAAIANGKMPPPPEDTSEQLTQFLAACTRTEPKERPGVEDLLASPWLVSVAKSDARQPLLAWLMKAAAKRMANKIIAA